MADGSSFPLYVFEKDDWSMFLIETPDDVFQRVEPLYLERNGYLFWNAAGRGVRLNFNRGKLLKLEETDNEIGLYEAFARYSQSLGATVETSGTPAEVWVRLRANEKPEPLWHRAVGNAIGLGCSFIVIAAVILVIAAMVGIIKAIFAR